MQMGEGKLKGSRVVERGVSDLNAFLFSWEPEKHRSYDKQNAEVGVSGVAVLLLWLGPRRNITCEINNVALVNSCLLWVW